MQDFSKDLTNINISCIYFLVYFHCDTCFYVSQPKFNIYTKISIFKRILNAPPFKINEVNVRYHFAPCFPLCLGRARKQHLSTTTEPWIHLLAAMLPATQALH